MESSILGNKRMLDNRKLLIDNLAENTDSQSRNIMEAKDLNCVTKPDLKKNAAKPEILSGCPLLKNCHSTATHYDSKSEIMYNQLDLAKPSETTSSNMIMGKETVSITESAAVPVTFGSMSEGCQFGLSFTDACKQSLIGTGGHIVEKCNMILKKNGSCKSAETIENKQDLGIDNQTKEAQLERGNFDSSLQNNNSGSFRANMYGSDEVQCEAIDFSKSSVKPPGIIKDLPKLCVKICNSTNSSTSLVNECLLTSPSSAVQVNKCASSVVNSLRAGNREHIYAESGYTVESSNSRKDECDSGCENSIETNEESGFPDFFKGIVSIGKCVSVKGDFTLKSSKALIESPSLVTPFLLKEPDVFPVGNDEEEIKCGSKEFFKSSVGEFLIGLGLSRVNEWHLREVMLKKMRLAKKENQSDTLNQEIEKYKLDYLEAKKANEPFTFSYKKCSFCGFITESDIVFESHLLAPHVTKFREYVCNYCSYLHRDPKEVLKHMKSSHDKVGFIQPPTLWLDCPYCNYETNSKVKLNAHLNKCSKCHNPATNQAPPRDFEFPCLTPKPITVAVVKAYEKSLSDAQKNRRSKKFENSADYLLSNMQHPPNQRPSKSFPVQSVDTSSNHTYFAGVSKSSYSCLDAFNQYIPFGQSKSQCYQALSSGNQSVHAASSQMAYPCFSNMKNQSKMCFNRLSAAHYPVSKDTDISAGFSLLPRLQEPYSGPWNKSVHSQNSHFHSSSLVVCEICDGYIKDMDQLRTHMQLIHKVKIHPKMLVSRPPLNCQKCQWRFFTDQGLERHLLGAHGLVTSNMQDLSNKGKDSGCCTICGRIFATKLVAHMTQSHKVTLKPAHLSYKCTVCSATFSLYRLFENHVYLVHSGAAKRSGNSEDISGSCKRFSKSGDICNSESFLKSIPGTENGIS